MPKLKLMREKKGMSIPVVAKHLGLARSTVWQYEAGKRKPSFDILVRLASLYECSLNDFVD